MKAREFQVDDGFLSLPANEQQAAVDEIAAQIGIRPPPQQPAQTSNLAGKSDQEVSTLDTVSDATQSVGTGLRAGIEQLIGLPGDVEDGVASAYEFVRGLVVDETPEEKARRLSVAESVAAPGLPSTSDIRDVTNQIVGKPRTPETTAGQYAKTIAEFVPSIAAGPGSVAKKGVTAVAAGGLSEAAGQATEGTAAEPLARAAGAIVGGGLSTLQLNRAAKKVLKEAPDAETVKKTTDALYNQLRASGIQYNPSQYELAIGSLAGKLQKKGFRKGTAPKAFSVVSELVEKIGGPLDFSDLDSIRQAAGRLVRDIDQTEKAAASIVIDSIDDIMLRTKSINTSGKPTAEISELVKRAREFASRNIKQRIIGDVIERAETYQSGFESGLRNGFSNLLRSKKAKSFTKEERAAIQQAAKGGTLNNALGVVGKFGFDLGNLGNRATLLPIGGGAAVGAVDPISGALLVGAGTVSKKAAQAGTRRAAEDVSKTVLAGKAAQKGLKKLSSSERRKINIRRLLTLDPALQQAANASE